jgi:lysyl-tRNA synthetase class 1
MLKRAKLEAQVQEIAKSSPLMAHIPQTIMGDNHVAATIGSVQEDALGRVMHQSNFTFQFEKLWLIQAFCRLFEKHEIVPELLAGWANHHAAFDDMSLLVEGIRAWTRTDHVKAVHVLIPQIERALRNIADSLDVPVTKPHPKVSGTSVVIGMGEILNNAKVAEALGPDTTLHFQALYADPRGMNLRNEVAHGMMSSDRFYFHLGNLVVHSLLILGLWKEFGAKRTA